MKRSGWKRGLSLALAVLLMLSCAACGGDDKTAAASMWLVKTEGKVAVSNDAGDDVPLTDRLGLFSGYDVSTQSASFGWINLDDTKLTKMDENSDVEVQKDGRHLTLVVYSGALFFNVTKHLEDDESLEIRAANMVTSIRGTSGWVAVPDSEHMLVYILDGTVECSVGDTAETVSAGEMASLSCTPGEEAIEKDTFRGADVPGFVKTEVPESSLPDEPVASAPGADATDSPVPEESAPPEGNVPPVPQQLLNEYGATVFELRENYVLFDDLSEEQQVLIEELTLP